MKMVDRQKTCPACGKVLNSSEGVSVEPLIDPSIRYVLCHSKCSTFVHKTK